MNNDHCAACGMAIEAPAYHPYLACVAFKALQDGNKVQANLRAVVEYGMKAAEAKVSIDKAMQNISRVIR